MTRFGKALRRKFSSPAEVWRALDMSPDVLGSDERPKRKRPYRQREKLQLGYDSFSAAEERRRSMPRDEEEDARQAAMHGHVTDQESPWDMEELASHLRQQGLADDAVETVMDTLHHHLHTLHHHHARDDEETPEERQRMLEHAEKRYAREDRRDDEGGAPT